MRIGCLTVTPVNPSGWTQYDVVDIDGKVTVHALGERAQALDLLDQACQEHSTDLVHLATDPRFDDLRTEDRFRKLIIRIAIPG